MIGSGIRQFATAVNTAWICAAFNETVLQIWDIKRRTLIGQFKAKFASGARNLALHPDGTQIVTGVSVASRGTISSYATPSGTPKWERRQLSYPARLRFSPSGHHLYCTVRNHSVEKIDALTGEVVSTNRNVSNYFEGQYDYSFIIPSSGSKYLLRDDSSGVEFSVVKLTFAPLDISFGPDCLYLTESTGPVRCINYSDGTERWRFTPPPGSHILRLHSNQEERFLYGILWHFEKGLFGQLVRLDTEAGQNERICDLQSWEEAFVDATHQLVTSAGDIIDLGTGRIVGTLAFPEVEYPDI